MVSHSSWWFLAVEQTVSADYFILALFRFGTNCTRMWCSAIPFIASSGPWLRSYRGVVQVFIVPIGFSWCLVNVCDNFVQLLSVFSVIPCYWYLALGSTCGGGNRAIVLPKPPDTHGHMHIGHGGEMGNRLEDVVECYCQCVYNFVG